MVLLLRRSTYWGCL